MTSRPSLAAALVATVAASVLSLGLAAPASADVPLSCGGSDLRSPTDKQPKQGMVAPYSDAGTTYWYKAGFDENQEPFPIEIAGLPETKRVTAVWENGTDCTGDDYSRNAWAVEANGAVYAGGSEYPGPPARYYGGANKLSLARPVVGMSPTGTGNGYWLVAGDGGIFSYGDARFHGSTGSIRLNKPVVGMSTTPSARGYWMVASDGGIFSFGDARFFGSTGSLTLNKPIIGMVATPTGKGYWLVASDGGVFTFGDAKFRGSLGGQQLDSPVRGLIPSGAGYILYNDEFYWTF